MIWITTEFWANRYSIGIQFRRRELMNPWKIHALALLILFISGCGGGGGGGDASGPPAPTANFSIDVTSGEAPVTVNFTDASIGNISFYTWNFGDGGSSTSQNPS
ncbi:MAG: hypothetical protein COB10_08305, partial [Planctomycetota bacterium]